MSPSTAPPSSPPLETAAPPPGQLAPQAHQLVRPTNTKAILAVALLSLAPAAIVFGVLARREIRRTGEGGWGLATWGMGIGIAVVALYVLYFGALVALYLAALVLSVAAVSSPALQGL